MNRCITCGKIVTRPKAQNNVTYDNHSYLVCCPMCEKEFASDPKHYVAVAKSVLGDYAVNAYSQTVAENSTNTDIQAVFDPTNFVRLLRNLQVGFDEIKQQYRELDDHLDKVSDSGGLNGLRQALNEHRTMMDSLHEKISVHAGVCRFVVSVAESSIKVNS